MNIRLTNADDFESVSHLISICYSRLMRDAYPANILDIALPLISKARPELLTSGTYFLATSDDGIPIGCGGWTKNSPDSKNPAPLDIGHIRHFATHPDFTNKGIGRSIFSLCKEQALNSSIHSFECFSSLNAENFYKALGFTTLSPLEIELISGISFPCIHMKCTL